MVAYSEERERLIQAEMVRNGGDRVMAELATRSPEETEEAGRIIVVGGRGGYGEP